MPELAPSWQSLLTLASFVAIIGVPVSIQLWARRRRRRGEEAVGDQAKGAEAIIPRSMG